MKTKYDELTWRITKNKMMKLTTRDKQHNMMNPMNSTKDEVT